VFETVDPVRIKNFKTMSFGENYRKLFNMYDKDKKPLSINRLIYDPWEGLNKFTQKDVYDGANRKVVIEHTPVPPDTSNMSDIQRAVMENQASAVTDLTTALKTAETMMKKEATIFVIQNIAKREEALLQALRSWTVDGKIFANKSTVFIFAESADLVLDEYTKRLCAVINIPLSTAEERLAIVDNLAQRIPSIDVDINSPLVQVSSGLTLHDTEASILESFFKHRTLSVDSITDFKTDLISKSGVLSFYTPKHTFDAVGGYEAIKSFIRNDIIALLKNPVKAEKMGLELHKGILLFGPPGTGKTLIAEAFAKP